MNSKTIKETKYYHLFVDEKLIQYKVIYSTNIKSKMYASVSDDLQECEYIIKAPYNARISNIEDFIYSNYLRLEHIKNKKFNNNFINLDSKILSFLGKVYKLDISYNQKRNKVNVVNDTFIVAVKNNYTAKDVIYSFFKKEAIKLIPDLVHKKSESIKIYYNSVTIKKLNKAWGNCKIKLKDLAFSYKLMHFDLPIIDYVICHELCHLIYPDHSKNFWASVKKICPNYKYYRNILKNFIT